MLTAGVFETTPYEAAVWRAVEAQHDVATMPLVDSLEEQRELEQLLERSKPSLPPECRGLHWLLFTPFRYPPLPSGSRFRGPADPGVFYAALQERTACAELGFWRWRFLMESPALEALATKRQTVFRCAIAGPAVNLTTPPLVARRAQWTDPRDYSICQALARSARDEAVQIIVYESVRDPEHGDAVGVLTAQAFARPGPQEAHTWLLTVNRRCVIWRLDSVLEERQFEFTTEGWS